MTNISLILVWTCLICMAKAATEQQQQAHGLEALAVFLKAADPSVAFSLPGHVYSLAQTNPTFRKDMMKANVKSRVAYKSNNIRAAAASSVVRERTIPSIFLRAATGLNKNLSEMMRASVAALTTRKAWMACAIGICADLVAQVIAGARVFEDWVPRQTLAMAVWSFCYTGTLRPVVDKQFDRLCGQGTSIREVFRKQSVELFLFKPICHVPALYMATGLMAGKGWLGSWHKLCSVYQETMLFSWLLWPVPLYFYFRHIPYSWRVLYYSFFAFIQKCGFSYLSLPGKR